MIPTPLVRARVVSGYDINAYITDVKTTPEPMYESGEATELDASIADGDGGPGGGGIVTIEGVGV